MSQQCSITLRLTCVGSMTGAVRSLFCGTSHGPVFAPGWFSGKMDRQSKAVIVRTPESHEWVLIKMIIMIIITKNVCIHVQNSLILEQLWHACWLSFCTKSDWRCLFSCGDQRRRLKTDKSILFIPLGRLQWTACHKSQYNHHSSQVMR